MISGVDGGLRSRWGARNRAPQIPPANQRERKRPIRARGNQPGYCPVMGRGQRTPENTLSPAPAAAPRRAGGTVARLGAEDVRARLSRRVAGRPAWIDAEDPAIAARELELYQAALTATSALPSRRQHTDPDGRGRELELGHIFRAPILVGPGGERIELGLQAIHACVNCGTPGCDGSAPHRWAITSMCEDQDRFWHPADAVSYADTVAQAASAISALAGAYQAGGYQREAADISPGQVAIWGADPYAVTSETVQAALERVRTLGGF